jgi:ATP-binding cassette subfamily B protein
MSCGPRALRRAALAAGVRADLAMLRRLAGTDRRGTSLAGLARAARAIGFEAEAGRADYAWAQAARRPFIAHLRPGHFVLVEACAPGGVRIAGFHPARLSRAAFERSWSGIVLTVTPIAAEGERP